MPPTPALVGMLHLKKGNRALASGLACLLLRAHVLLIPSITAWCFLFWRRF